jgi:hypothetical protein
MATTEEIEQILSRLASAPARYAAALSRLEDADSVAGGSERATPGDWSPPEVFAHVRAAQDILEPRIFYTLVNETPPLLAYDERRWAEIARYATLPVIESLEMMRLRRNELVRALRGIAPEDWERSGTHEVRGPMTVMEIARYIADHEDEHVAQIESGVGP